MSKPLSGLRLSGISEPGGVPVAFDSDRAIRNAFEIPDLANMPDRHPGACIGYVDGHSAIYHTTRKP